MFLNFFNFCPRKKLLREVEATLFDERIHNSVHDGHQRENQNGVHCLHKTKKHNEVKMVPLTRAVLRSDTENITYLHLIRLQNQSSLQAHKTRL